jgi:hypothetical protein
MVMRCHARGRTIASVVLYALGYIGVLFAVLGLAFLRGLGGAL